MGLTDYYLRKGQVMAIDASQNADRVTTQIINTINMS